MHAVYEKVFPPSQHSFLWREDCGPRFRAPWHFHPEIELTVILRSHGLRYVGDSIEPFAEGDLVLVGADLPHRWQNHGLDGADPVAAHAVCIQFLPEFLGADFLTRPELAGIAALLRRARRGIRFVGTRLGKEATARMKKMGALTGAARLLELLGILHLLARAKHFRVLSSVGFAPSLNLFDAERVNRVHAYVQAHLQGPVFQRQAAAAVHMSPASFSRFFRQKTGKTFSAFVNEVRVGRATQLLLAERLAITQICYECGFENLSTFNRQFKRIKAMTPRDFVRRHRSGEGV